LEATTPFGGGRSFRVMAPFETGGGIVCSLPMMSR
jgi:hypothetical protein